MIRKTLRSSLRHQQRFGERPLPIYPLLLAAKSCGHCQLKKFGTGILVATFGPDGFAGAESYGKSRPFDADVLVSCRTQMHFDAARFCIETRFVRELRQNKISTKLAVDASQQIEVERGSHAQTVVIRIEHLRGGLHQVSAEQKRIARLQ